MVILNMLCITTSLFPSVFFCKFSKAEQNFPTVDEIGLAQVSTSQLFRRLSGCSLLFLLKIFF